MLFSRVFIIGSTLMLSAASVEAKDHCSGHHHDTNKKLQKQDQAKKENAKTDESSAEDTAGRSKDSQSGQTSLQNHETSGRDSATDSKR